MNAITLRSGKQLEETQGAQREVDEGLVKDKGREILEEKDDLVLENGGQDKHEETTNSNLKSMMERFVQTQIKINGALGESIS